MNVGCLLADFDVAVLVLRLDVLHVCVGCLTPEVDEDNADTVEGVVDDGCYQGGLAQAHDGVLVQAQHTVVGLRRDAHDGGIEDVDKKEEENRDTGNAVSNPGPHAPTAAVEGSLRTIQH